MQLYDIGYLDIKEFDLLVKTIIALDAVLVDVRFSPQSRAPQWRQKYLAENLPDGTYVHMQSLGNEAYKTPGAFSFPDLDGGMKAIHRSSEDQKRHYDVWVLELAGVSSAQNRAGI